MRSVVMMVMVLAGPAMAADGPWTAAPVPGVTDPHVQPAARAGTDASQTVGTPFSGIPQGSVAADGSTSSDIVNGVQTPNLSGK